MKLKKDFFQFREFVVWIKPDFKSFLPGLAIILTIKVSAALLGVALAIASKNMIDYAVAGALYSAGLAGALFGVLIVLGIMLRIGDSVLSLRVNESFANAMRQRYFQRLLETEWLPLSGYHSGDLLTRLTSDVNNVTNCIVNVIPGILALAVQLAASFAALLHYEPRLALATFVLGPSAVLFSRVWGRKLKQLNIKVQESESLFRAFIQEALQNFTVIKSFRLEKRNREVLQVLHNNRMRWISQKNRTTVSAETIISLGFWAGYFLAFGWGAFRLAQQAISFGTMTAFLTLVQQIQSPFAGLARTFPQIIAMLASAERLRELEKMEAEKKAGQVSKPEKVGISCRQVSFRYVQEKTVLDEINVDIAPGEMVALVGPSGAGKTTMVRLLLALLRPSQGQVFYTDAEGCLYEATAETRDWVTYVPQGNTLFSGTIAENLRSGKPDATPLEMEQAARAACAWGFIQKLPFGLETEIGERGCGLSEGQAQRIAIARAILKKAPVMILDEATAALDVETEIEILKSIKALNKGCTCLIITHRQTPLKMCSRILRIRDGKVTEEPV